MSKSIMISMLRQGETGSEILQILNSLTEDQSDEAEPTLSEIQF